MLGPFQGKPACIHIPWGKGVCGTAAAENRSVRVADVHAFPGHIACDSASRSELVVPLRKNGEVIGVLDLDSPELNRFSEEDQQGLEEAARVLSGMIRMDRESRFELKAARHLAAEHLAGTVRPGDTVIDATAGNGHDTCFLAELVGAEGKVFAFDVQEKAIESTREKLREQGLLSRVMLIRDGHQHMKDHVQAPVRSVSFNLGWLPGGDKALTTRWETTREALDQALELLLPGGICTVCAYPAHEAGEEERRSLEAYLSALRPQEFNVLQERFLNAGPGAPECFVIQKMK